MAEPTHSRLLSLPPEIRREVFLQVLAPGPKLHLYLQDSRPRVSPCFGANLGAEDYEDYHERAVPPQPGVTKGTRIEEWTRRVRSAWANHYMCEEVRDGKRFSDHPVRRVCGYTYALLVCKQMWIECTEIMGDLLEVTVTDLESAHYLTRLGKSALETTPPDADSTPPPIRRALLTSTRSLRLSLYQAPKFYWALALPRYVPGGWTPTGDAALRLYDRQDPEAIFHLWHGFCAGLAELPRLSCLTVWLDNNARSWADMDEKAILSPLSDTTESLPRLRLAVHLPEVSEEETGRQKHFRAADGDLRLALGIQRRNRRPTRNVSVW